MDLVSPEFIKLEGRVYHLKQLHYGIIWELFERDTLKGLIESKRKAIAIANKYYKIATKVKRQKHLYPEAKNCSRGKTTKHRSSADTYCAMYNNFVHKMNRLVSELEFEIRCKLEEQ